MSVLIILNDAPYGSERSYNGLRLAIALQKSAEASGVTVFLMADAVASARRGQKTPEGFYNIERMLHRVTAAGGAVLLCGTCMDARGITAEELVGGTARSSMDELAAQVAGADKVVVF
jgi:uncharacterized protein involved in oxidation of intracellular sulfur